MEGNPVARCEGKCELTVSGKHSISNMFIATLNFSKHDLVFHDHVSKDDAVAGFMMFLKRKKRRSVESNVAAYARLKEDAVLFLLADPQLKQQGHLSCRFFVKTNTLGQGQREACRMEGSQDRFPVHRRHHDSAQRRRVRVRGTSADER